MRVTVLIGPEAPGDRALIEEIAGAELARLSASGQVLAADDAPALRSLLAAPAEAFVVLPGPQAAARELMTGPGPHAARTVWLDLRHTGPARVADGAAHIHGRGMDGLAWALRHAVYRTRHPARRVPYGEHPDQWADLRLPVDPRRAGAEPPVAVLVHGGFWRSVWGADLMDAAAVDLAGRGFSVWNLEYRRPDAHGWAATTSDVAAGLAAASAGSGPLVVLGHSAGGTLALRAAADAPGRVALAVSLAGVLDLAEGDRRRMGNGAVAMALGGHVAGVPDVYAQASPIERLPLGVRQLIVQGAGDETDFVDMGRRHARAAGEEAVLLERPGGHFDVIDPGSAIWQAMIEEIFRLLS
ncbi:alpha/beta hydrolase family protein [Spongiactinospora gelatinilytica]|uniref:alpha/beta hydrolase family protein n=1 Tax=Spongiactinospora gelatinilytica TaxID=2666298 RepID=UPI0018F5DC44|nr:alpha/beta fold hydrolase [Spongiactinospora gelatinilytica]